MAHRQIDLRFSIYLIAQTAIKLDEKSDAVKFHVLSINKKKP